VVQSFREHDATSPVLLISADPDPPDARPPLTKDYLTGESKRSELWLAEERWFADHAVSLRLGTEVVALDRAARLLRLDDGTTHPVSRPTRRCGRLTRMSLPWVTSRTRRTRPPERGFASSIGATRRRTIGS
jgi:NADPH-dependent 2,4-dienoyl-CoA reductase/sulfur reductase-like enzyme